VTPLLLSEADVSKVFHQLNTRKAMEPDGIPWHVLRACEEQLAGIFRVIFNLSLSQSVIPTCFKMTTIIPVHKNSKASSHNVYHPVVLTIVIMRCFERLVMAHINSTIPDTPDPLQIAYCPNRPIDNAISIAIPTALTHLDKRNTYV
jgi:hypothetical protein